MKKIIVGTLVPALGLFGQTPIIHDAEYNILEAQNGQQ